MLAAEPSHGSSALKLSQLFRYAQADGQRRAQIWMPKQVALPPHSPWLPLLEEGWIRQQPHPNPALVLVSDAADWRAADRLYGTSTSRPRLQVFWGGDLRCWGHGALTRPAIRVALGEAVAQQLAAGQRLREPIHTLPMALDPEDLPAPGQATTDQEVLLLASTNATLGLALQQSLIRRGVRCRSELSPWPMPQWQSALAAARVVVVLAPPPGEASFGLRRLAAMALRVPLVCEQQLLNDQLCRDGRNCLLRPSNPEALADAVISLLDPSGVGLRRQLVDGGLATLVRHRRARERLEFEQLLDQHQQHWHQALSCHSDLKTASRSPAPSSP